MEDLLTILNRITSYTSEHCFVRFCWHYLSEVMNSKDANKWDSCKRSRLIWLSSYLIEGVRAVFITRDTLIRNNETDLSSPLVGRLSEHLTWLEEFSSEIDLEDLDEMLSECAESLINDGADYWETIIIELVASSLKLFFLSVHALKISERIKLANTSC